MPIRCKRTNVNAPARDKHARDGYSHEECILLACIYIYEFKYTRQKNCTRLRRTNREYHNNLDIHLDIAGDIMYTLFIYLFRSNSLIKYTVPSLYTYVRFLH